MRRQCQSIYLDAYRWAWWFDTITGGRAKCSTCINAVRRHLRLLSLLRNYTGQIFLKLEMCINLYVEKSEGRIDRVWRPHCHWVVMNNFSSARQKQDVVADQSTYGQKYLVWSRDLKCPWYFCTTMEERHNKLVLKFRVHGGTLIWKSEIEYLLYIFIVTVGYGK